MSGKRIYACALLLASAMLACALPGYAGTSPSLVPADTRLHAQGPPESIPVHALPGDINLSPSFAAGAQFAYSRVAMQTLPDIETSTERAAEGPRLSMDKTRDATPPLRVGWRS